jgi:hypothetical protein
MWWGRVHPPSAPLESLHLTTELIDLAFKCIELAALLLHVTALPLKVRGGAECPGQMLDLLLHLLELPREDIQCAALVDELAALTVDRAEGPFPHVGKDGIVRVNPDSEQNFTAGISHLDASALCCRTGHDEHLSGVVYHLEALCLHGLWYGLECCSCKTQRNDTGKTHKQPETGKPVGSGGQNGGRRYVRRPWCVWHTVLR